jgi:hypothetical protein
LEAVFVARLRQLADRAQQLTAVDDPGAAFETFFPDAIAEPRTWLTTVDALALAGIDLTRPAADAKRDLNPALGELLAHAQQAGAVRADVGLSEVLALIVGIVRAVQQGGSDAALDRARCAWYLMGWHRTRTASLTGVYLCNAE